MSLPGGCAIGSRPVNFHLAGLEKMGRPSKSSMATSRPRPVVCGKPHLFRYPSVTGTENLMMAAVLAEGITVLENAAKEPEISDQPHSSSNAGTHCRRGDGYDHDRRVTELHGADHDVIPDRIKPGPTLWLVRLPEGRSRSSVAVLSTWSPCW